MRFVIESPVILDSWPRKEALPVAFSQKLHDGVVATWANKAITASNIVPSAKSASGEVTCFSKFAVWSSRHEIGKKLQSGNRVVIRADTGAGKSLTLPFVILDLDPTAKILVIQPTRMTTEAIGNYARSMNTEKVGWAHGRKRHGTDQGLFAKVSILYCTTGLASKILASNNAISHVICDEIHRRPTDVLSMLEKARCAKKKLLFVSATIHPKLIEKIRSYFYENVTDFSGHVDVIEVESERRFWIKNVDYQKLRTRPEKLSSEKHFEQSLIGQADCNELIEPDSIALKSINVEVDLECISNVIFECYKHSTATTKKNILVFLPGLTTINGVKGKLAEEKWFWNKIQNYSMHSQLDVDPGYEGVNVKRPIKVFMVTDVVESGITLPNIGYVVDSCLKKTPDTYNKVGIVRLATVHGDQTTLDQRKGRTGRVCNGYYIPMVSKAALDSIALTEPEPLVMHSELESLYLDGIMDRQFLFDKNYLDPLPGFLQDEAISSLMSGGFCGLDKRVTDIGVLAGLFPILEPDLALLVCEGCFWGCLQNAVEMAAILQADHPFINQKRSDKKSAFITNEHCQMASDHLALLRAYKDADTKYDSTDKANKEFRQKYSAKAVEDVRIIVRRIADVLFRIGMIDGRDSISNPLYNKNGENIWVFQLIIVASMRRVLIKDPETALMFPMGSNEHILPENRNYSGISEDIAVYHRVREYSDGHVHGPLTYCSKLMYAMFGASGSDHQYFQSGTLQIPVVGGHVEFVNEEIATMASISAYRHSRYTHFMNYMMTIQTGNDYPVDDSATIAILPSISAHFEYELDQVASMIPITQKEDAKAQEFRKLVSWD